MNALYQEIMSLPKSPRIESLKKKMLDEPRYVSIEQAHIVTEVYRQTEGEPACIRRAKALKAALEQIKIRIEPDEWIVGNRTAGVRAGVVFPETGASWVDREFETLPTRPQDRFLVRPEDIVEFRERILPYWKGVSLEDQVRARAGEEVNAIAREVSGRIYSEFERHACTPGGRYFPVSNQFTTYEDAGKGVRATPDGRADGEPLCDSCGAVYGRDVKGPTALLSSVAALRLDLVIGTPVTNIRISKPRLPVLLKPLVQGFFRKGGMQLQVTCASREELLDALEHPEKHESLIVRMGGFAEYFNRLTPVLKQTVIDRTEY